MTDMHVAVMAFTEAQASRLSGVKVSRMRYWDKTDLYSPSIGDQESYRALGRNYSFSDVVGLKTIGILRDRYKIPLQHLRKVAEHMRAPQDVWSKETIFVKGREIYFSGDSENFKNGATGEETLPNVPLIEVIRNIEAEAARLRIRPKDAFGKTEKTRGVLSNAEVFDETRIPISIVKEYWDAGLGAQEIIADYPSINIKDIQRAVEKLGLKAA